MINQDLLAWARSYIGVAEIEGDLNNATIMEMARILGLTQYTSDQSDWCGLFMSFLAHVTGAEKPSSFLIARNWLAVGAPVIRPIEGDLCVLWRNAPDSGFGHVGLYVGEDAANVFLLGGNQVGKVREFNYAKERILGYRRLWRAS